MERGGMFFPCVIIPSWNNGFTFFLQYNFFEKKIQKSVLEVILLESRALSFNRTEVWIEKKKPV